MSSNSHSSRGKSRHGKGSSRGSYNNKFSGRTRPEKTRYTHQDQLTEEEVGVSKFISKLEGYQAIIKARFSDFQVSEINDEGKMAKLTDQTIPTEFIPKKVVMDVSYEDTIESPMKEIPQEAWEAMKTLVSSEEQDIKPVYIEGENLTKKDRRTIHQCVKNYFGRKIVASTIQKDGKMLLEIRKFLKGEKPDIRSEWPKDKPEFVHFILYKESMDTMEASLRLAELLRIPPMKITYAGTKDRRAKTSQFFCIKKVDPTYILQRSQKIRNMKVGNFEFKNKCLRIGQLKGNRFRIALRNVQAEDDLINASLEHVKEHGFINYYGMQRFGNDKEVPTYLIGVKLLLGQWQEAVELILKVKPGDDPDFILTKTKKLYAETKSAKEALALCGKRASTSLEVKLLQGLAKNAENDFVNALENIPRNVRLMYIHAFQSLIWNKMVSKRISEFGLKPIEGDLVFVNESQEEKPITETDSDDDDDDENDDIQASDTENKEKPEVKFWKPDVKALKADELEKYSIFDVVLPLPGYDIVYPENMKQYYKEAVEELGLDIEMPKQSVRTYNLSGTYRKLLGRVQDLEWKIIMYKDPTDNLIRSDYEEMNGEPEPTDAKDGTYKAVVVSFTLNPASYATMVLREILKCNTSSSVQSKLNNYGEEPKAKVLLDNSSETAEPKKDGDELEVQPGSLLANKEKYEAFKNSLFADILGETNQDDNQEDLNKRKLEENDGENESSTKRLKVDD